MKLKDYSHLHCLTFQFLTDDKPRTSTLPTVMIQFSTLLSKSTLFLKSSPLSAVLRISTLFQFTPFPR